MSYRIRYKKPRRRKSPREILSVQCLAAALLLGFVLICAMAGGPASAAAEAVFLPASGVRSPAEGGADAFAGACRAYIFGED